jgi:hypothetical protein
MSVYRDQFNFTSAFQQHLAACLLQDPSLFPKYNEKTFQAFYFQDREVGVIMQEYLRLRGLYNLQPGRVAVENAVAIRLEAMNEEYKLKVLKLLADLYALVVTDRDLLEYEAVQFAIYHAGGSAILEAPNFYENNKKKFDKDNLQKLARKIEDTLMIGLPTSDDWISNVDFLVRKYPNRPVLIENVVKKGARSLLTAPSKSRKSFMMMSQAIALATGTHWLGLQCTKCRVLYINLELFEDECKERWLHILKAKGIINPTDTQEQWVQVMKARQIDATIWNLRDKLFDEENKPLEVSAFVELLRARIRAAGREFDAIVIDPVYKLLGTTDENDNTGITQLFAQLGRLSHVTEATISASHHFRKGAQSASVGEKFSGAGAFLRDTDAMLEFELQPQPEGVSDDDFAMHPCFTVHTIVRSFRPMAPFCVRFNHPLMERDDTLDPKNVVSAKGRPSKTSGTRLLELLSEAGLTSTEWSKLAQDELQISDSTFRKYRDEMLLNGVIRKVGKQFVKAGGATTKGNGYDSALADRLRARTKVNPEV